MMNIKANLVDLHQKTIYPASITIENGIIASIERLSEDLESYILPGFIDAHIHIESSLLVPSEFARMAVLHGTVATVSDPHEIANVCGVKGVEYMIDNSKKVPFHFFFGAPSCVPATIYETAGATIESQEVEVLMQNDDIWYLAEMMNFPGVLFNDPSVLAKLQIAKKYNKPIDGHAPGLMGDDARRYFEAGPSTDHECFTYEEALGKIALGMKVIIREGSAARNFDALIPLMKDHSNMLMFCSDDKHPDSLISGHINQLVTRALKKGHDIFDVLKVACINPILHYGLPVGTLQVGDPADFIITSDLQEFKTIATYIKGHLVANEGQSLIPRIAIDDINQFNIDPIDLESIKYIINESENVIECLDGQLITNKLIIEGKHCNVENDILKLVVVNRYNQTKPAISFIKIFGLKRGAMASSVAHDSHNIIATGTNDMDILNAINEVIHHKGALSAANGNEIKTLPLAVAGLMSGQDAWEVTNKYTDLDQYCKVIMGSTLRAPYMSLSFMALLVIPSLKLSDKGLFDGDKFQFMRLE